ncbi:hypothetical protein OEIGOIKO_04901 [Streptomyces chrestomyceticus JCM 4735]|uniref:C2H2-type domain-containing protein n=1 Tax=Streptomyces chrestomyceticus JCM 4735 TaxID=1306181 RepID=A0A7U9PZ79_9ACTN|nr:hypothetical protein [Streptomyces chrestomyceticus]GCD37118.1 hypothetical protein OEIGOIKO_04901 [Streptomyces chrestomyceticus JCM 4735]
MSDIARTPGSITAGAHPIPPADPPAHEAYAFACMRCGHGWEQSYEITHHVDADGRAHCVYYADGERVPSPLTRPTCLNCGAHVVRIMRAGQVSMVSKAIASLYEQPSAGAAEGNAGAGAGTVPQQSENSESTTEGGASADGHRERHHWHLADLLHPFQHHRR